jgi:hypothetical protein
MLTAFRWLIRIVSGLIGLGVIATLLAYYILSRSLVDYDEDFTVAGISAPVEIVRNNDNVPHIFGKTDEDVFYALGFAHAQDRLWQMTMLRRTAQGRLSELFGPSTVKVDELMRRYDLYGLALESVKAQDPETLAALEAYSAGVNAWIEEVNKGARGRGAPEFFLFEPETDGAAAFKRPADRSAAGAGVSASVPRTAGGHSARRPEPGCRGAARLCQPGAGSGALDAARRFRGRTVLAGGGPRDGGGVELVGGKPRAVGGRGQPSGERPAPWADGADDLVPGAVAAVDGRRDRRDDPRGAAGAGRAVREAGLGPDDGLCR